MKLFGAGKNRPPHRAELIGRDRESAHPTSSSKYNRRTAGNVFFALFAAVAMVGTVGYGMNTVLRGPIKSMTDVTRRTVAESTIVTSSRLAVVGATTQQTDADCDADGMVEPMPFRDPAGKPAPVGGGYLPTDLVPDSIDPWKTEYGYCAWDSGTATVTDNVVACGGNTAKRLVGAPNGKQYAIAIISAGKNKKFETTCAGYVDTTPADGKPDAPMLGKPTGSDDIVLGYTYAEANDLGAGMWKPVLKDVDNDGTPDDVATTRNALEGTKGASFGGAINLQGNVLTGGGLVLPGDPGDDSLTGACNAANDKQIRRNTATVPPTLEICNFAGGLGWSPLSGAATSGGGGGAMTGTLVSRWMLDETSGTVVSDSIGGNNGTIVNGGPGWTDDSVIGGALDFQLNGNQNVVIPRSTSLEPTAVTVSTWVKVTGTMTGTLVNKQWHAQYGYGDYPSYVLLFENNRPTFWTKGAAGGCAIRFQQNTPVTAGQWAHLVATYDPSATAPQMKLYLNGKLDAFANCTDPIIYDTTSDGDMYLGSSGPQGWWAGLQAKMDDVRIYNYAISDVEAHNLYNSSKPPIKRNTTSTKAGYLVSWGLGNHGSLGNIASGSTPSPTAVTSGNDFVQASAGESISGCGVKAGGTVWCWGWGMDGAGGNTAVPTKVKNLTDVVKVSTGGYHSCAIKRNGEAWCWGSGQEGALGNGATTTSYVPVKVSNITDFVDISASGWLSTCGVRANGEAWCWGFGTSGTMGNGTTTQTNTLPVKVSNITDFTSISLADNGSYGAACGTTKRGVAYCWGTEQTNNFGNGAAGGSLTPVQISNITDFVNVKVVASFNSHGCGLRANGQIWCWGADGAGQLGNGATGATNVPGAVDYFSDFVDFAMDTNGTCGLRANKELWCWGADTSMQLGNGAAVTANQVSPVKIWTNVLGIGGGGSAKYFAILDSSVRPLPSALPVQKLASNTTNFSPIGRCAISKDGTAWCWGEDGVGQLGNGAVTGTKSAPSKVADNGPWTQISGDSKSFCGIKSNGTLWCWGENGTNGLLGVGTTTATYTSPTQVITTVPANTNPWAMVSQSASGGCGIKTDGTLWCWGIGANGRIGNGSTSIQISPVQVGTGRWIFVAAGIQRTCGITQDRRAWCWGSDGGGALGNGSVLTAQQNSPSLVADQGPWYSIASIAAASTCGVKVDGTGWCWGNSNNGILGNNVVTNTDHHVPQLIAEPGPWLQIEDGSTISCGLKLDGSAWCWGSNASNGYYGNGSTVASVIPYPLRVSSGNDWVEVHGGYSPGCGIKKDDTIWCWGADGSGILGNGPYVTAIQSRPYRVSTIPLRDPWIPAEHGGGFDLMPGVDAIVGSARSISSDGTANNGLQFVGSGRTSLRSTALWAQMTLESISEQGLGTYDQDSGQMLSAGTETPSSQITFDSASVTDPFTIPGNGTSTAPTSGMVARWKFDDGSGTTVAEELNANKNLRITGMDSGVWDTGHFGAGYRLDTSTATYMPPDYSAIQRVTTTPSVSHSTGFTISTWIKPESGGSIGNIILYDFAALEWDMSQNEIRCSWPILGGGGSRSTQTLSYSMTVGTWYNIVCTFGDVPSDVIIYVNGVQEYINGILGGNLQAGWDDVYIDDTGESVIDDLRIYDRALNATEVGQIYNDTGDGSTTVTTKIMRAVGTELTTGNFKIARSTTLASDLLGNLNADIEVTTAGNVGIGTLGSPQAKLDVNGAIKIGDDGTCTAAKDGMINWNGTAMMFCNNGTWKDFGLYGGEIFWSSVGQYNQGNCAVTNKGAAYCWGIANNGRLGDGQSSTAALYPQLVQTDTGPGAWSDWDKMSVPLGTDWYNCGLRVNGTAWCMGSEQYGKLGNNVTGATTKTRPSQVRDSAGTGVWTDWINIDNGYRHSCGLRTNGTLWCWGIGGSDGLLGNGVTGGGYSSQTPVQVQDNVGPGVWTDWKQVSVGHVSACGIRTNGTLWCWGTASDSTLGDNQNTVARSRPSQVTDDVGTGYWSDWISVSAGREQTCGIRKDHSLWCWGTNTSGGLGTGNTTPSARPVQMQDNVGPGVWTDWIQVSVGYLGVCGIRANGTAWCLGYGFDGLNGDNSGIARSRPVQVQTDTGPGGWNDWLNIQRGDAATCGIRTNGTLWCWGTGYLGVGSSSTISLRPTKVMVP